MMPRPRPPAPCWCLRCSMVCRRVSQLCVSPIRQSTLQLRKPQPANSRRKRKQSSAYIGTHLFITIAILGTGISTCAGLPGVGGSIEHVQPPCCRRVDLSTSSSSSSSIARLRALICAQRALSQSRMRAKSLKIGAMTHIAQAYVKHSRRKGRL